MQDIYRHTRRILIWLGPAAEMSDEVIDFLHGQFELVEPLFRRLRGPGISIEEAGDFQDVIQKPDFDFLWKPLVTLLRREYWHRTWIIQEVFFANDITIKCGSKSATWDTLILFINLVMVVLNKLPRRPEILHTDIAQVHGATHFCELDGHRFRILNPYFPLPPMSFGDYIERHRHSSCSDPRDKVYSLLGPANVKDFPLINYGLSIREVYVMAFKYCVGTSRKLNIICGRHIHTKGDYRHDDVLPGWIPDWASVMNPEIMGSRRTVKPFRASASRKPMLEYLDNDWILSVEGFIVDHVAAVIPTTTRQDWPIWGDNFQHINERICRWFEFANSDAVLAIKPFDADSFWRTLHFDSENVAREFSSCTEPVGVTVDLAQRKIITFGDKRPKGVFLDRLYSCQFLRKLSLTGKGMFCMSTIKAKEGDLVCVFLGWIALSFSEKLEESFFSLEIAFVMVLCMEKL